MASGSTHSPAELEICVEKQTVRYRGRQAKLSDFSFRMLRLLGESAPGPVTFEEIERVVWAAQVTRETIKQRVKMLRDSLATLGFPEDGIAAARNVGYRLTLPLGRYEPAAAETRPRRAGRAWSLGGGLAVCAAALAFYLAQPKASAAATPLSLSVRNEPLRQNARFDPAAWEGARRILIRDLSKMPNLVVVSAAGGDPVPDLAVEMALVPVGGGERITLQLIQTDTRAVLWAETYPADVRTYDRAITHFAANIHSQVEALGLRLGSDGFPQQPADVQQLYMSAVSLARGGSEAGLLAARARLEAALASRPAFALARSQKAQIEAQLVIGHRGDREMASRALLEARSLVEAHPEVPAFRRTLATAQIATGNLPEALRNLEIAEREMPFLRRDILALRRRMQRTG